jgi:hypothetical protein
MKIKISQFKQILQEEYQKMLLEQETTDLSVLDWTKRLGKTPGAAAPGSSGFEAVKDIGGGLSSGFFDKPSEFKDYPRQKTELEMTPEEKGLLDRLNIPYQRAPEGEVEMGRRTKLDKPKPKPPITNIFKSMAFDGGLVKDGEELPHQIEGYTYTIEDMYIDNLALDPWFNYNSSELGWPDNRPEAYLKNLKAMQGIGSDWRTTKDFILPYYDKRYGKKGQNLRRRNIRPGQFNLHDTPIRIMTVEQAKKDPNVHQYTPREELQMRRYVRKKLMEHIIRSWQKFFGDRFDHQGTYRGLDEKRGEQQREVHQKMLLELETTDLSVLDWTKGRGTTPGVARREFPGFDPVKYIGGGLSVGQFEDERTGPRDPEGRLYPGSWRTMPAHPNWIHTTTPGGPITGQYPRNWPKGLYCQGEECWLKVPELPKKLKTASEMTEEERALLDRLGIQYENR